MHRPMRSLHDPEEERVRRQEYADILFRLNVSWVRDSFPPDDSNSFPARILRWQYETNLLAPHGDGQQDAVGQRSEHARNLAHHIIAADAGMSVESLTKLCRNFEPSPTSVDESDCEE